MANKVGTREGVPSEGWQPATASSTFAATLRLFWRSTRGFRWRPWASPYLRWRIETYWGWPAAQLTAGVMMSFTLSHAQGLVHYLQWAAQMAVAERGRWQS